MKWRKINIVLWSLNILWCFWNEKAGLQTRCAMSLWKKSTGWKKKKTCVKKATLRRSFLKEKAWWIRERRKSLAKLKSSRFWGTQSFSFIHEHSRGMGRPVQQSPSAVAKEARGSQAGLAFNSECLPPVLIQDKIPGSVLVSTKRPPGWGCLGSRNKQASTSCDTTERCLGSSKCWREFSSCKHSPCSATALY